MANTDSNTLKINLIDVGSAGNLPEPWASRPDAIGRILSFEPREDSRTVSGVVHVAATLWDREEERNFFVYRGMNGSDSSLFLINYDYVLNNFASLKQRDAANLADTWMERSLMDDVMRVKCRTLDGVLRERPFGEPLHFLKIDAQGAEYQILRGAENYLRSQCLGLQLELFTLPLYRDITLMDEVAAWLAQLGFELVRKYPAHGSFNSQHECVFLKRGVQSAEMNLIRGVYGLAPNAVQAKPDNSRYATLKLDTPPKPLKQQPTALPQSYREQALARSRELFGKFKDVHKGQRCVVIGNGPSLNRMELGWLKDEITFGMNKIYLGFDKWDFRPSYYVSVNPLVIEQSAEVIQSLTMPRFLSANGLKFFPDPGDMIFLQGRDGPYFAEDPRQGIWEGYTVTYVALQLAYFMGFQEVALIGVDHNFTAAGKPNQEVTSQGDDQNHFHPGYFGKGSNWNLPDLENSEIAYRLARKAYETVGRRIVDATLDGKCAIFPKVDYREWSRRGKADGMTSEAVQLNTQGEELFNQGRVDDALELYQRALHLNGDDAELLNNLAVAYFHKGDISRARQHISIARELAPDDEDVMFNLQEIERVG